MKKHIKFATLLLSLTLVASLFLGALSRDDAGVDALRRWQAGVVVTAKAVNAIGEQNCFCALPLSDEVFNRMRGKSYPQNCNISRDELRYVKLLHKNINGQIVIGEMVVNKAIAADVVEIFRKLYKASYPIERMVLIDNYDADDERSMRDNNTSSFCYRQVKNTNKLSAHSRGMAVDVNTLYNPYYKDLKNGTRMVQPSTASRYCDRSKNFPYKITKGDLCYRLFIEKGFQWGGSWKSCKDFQHFEK